MAAPNKFVRGSRPDLVPDGMCSAGRSRILLHASVSAVEAQHRGVCSESASSSKGQSRTHLHIRMPCYGHPNVSVRSPCRRPVCPASRRSCFAPGWPAAAACRQPGQPPSAAHGSKAAVTFPKNRAPAQEFVRAHLVCAAASFKVATCTTLPVGCHCRGQSTDCCRRCRICYRLCWLQRSCAARWALGGHTRRRATSILPRLFCSCCMRSACLLSNHCSVAKAGPASARPPQTRQLAAGRAKESAQCASVAAGLQLRRPADGRAPVYRRCRCCRAAAAATGHMMPALWLALGLDGAASGQTSQVLPAAPASSEQVPHLAASPVEHSVLQGCVGGTLK